MMVGDGEAHKRPEMDRQGFPAAAESHGHGSEQVCGTRQSQAPSAQIRVSPAKPLTAFFFDLGHVSL